MTRRHLVVALSLLSLGLLGATSDTVVGGDLTVKGSITSVQTPNVQAYPLTTRFAGTHYIGGFYFGPTTDVTLTNASPTATLGTADVSYAAHALSVSAGAGTASGGTGTVTVVVSGTSITDAGVRTPADSEILIADITAESLDSYNETPKKWLGQATYTVTCSGGCTHTTFSVTINTQYAKYDDRNNNDFTIVGFKCDGSAGATDAGFALDLLLHSSAGWAYAASGFVPGGTSILSLGSLHGTEDNLANNEPFALKQSSLAQAVMGSTDEGYIIRAVTTAVNAIDSMECFVSVTF